MKIALLGDIAFFGKNSVENNPNVFNYFEDVATILKGFDHVIGNLETPFVTDQKTNGNKSAFIKSSPRNVALLKYLNVDIVNLANNHMYDYGIDSHRLTKRTLEENNIHYFGTDDKQHFIQEKDVKIALSGYCCLSSNPLGVNDGLNILNVKLVEENILDNHKNGFFNIVAMHCGQEHVHTPNYDHVRLARQLSTICPYVFYGHHPHVIQGIESKNKALLAYSLGNFCFDDIYTEKSGSKPFVALSEANKKSYILALEVNETGMVSYERIPVYMGIEKFEVGNKEILKDIEQYSLELEKEKNQYIQERQAIRQRYINSRKELRNIKWYLSRLNFSSVKMILSTKKNRQSYIENVVKYLK